MQPPQVVDVLVVGAGPAGLMASLCLTTYGFKILHIDEREEPTKAGRADGLQPRTLEVLRNIGAVTEFDEPGDVASGGAPLTGGGPAKEMIKQGVRVYEVSFWDPTETSPLARTSRAPSCPDFVDVEDNYTLLLHQGRIERAYLKEIEVRRRRLPPSSMTSAPWGGCFRSFAIKDVKLTDPNSTHPVTSIIVHTPSGKEYTIRSKYVFGNDGARSVVRRCIAGGEQGDGEWKGKIRMEGEATDIVWGVMDASVKTDFPDLKCKNLIHSKSEGSIMTIPREANLCRFYVQLKSDEVGKHVERSAATQEICMQRAKKIFEPFQIEFGYVDWFSVYQIGQRIASNYTLDNRIFLGGDATHTHSPKAGQGMNLSCLDMYDLCWKLNLVEKGIASPSILSLYESERRSVAQALLKFDAEYSRLFSGRNPQQSELSTSQSTQVSSGKGAVDAQKFIEVFKKNAFFTSGCGAVYNGNILNAKEDTEIGKKWKEVFNPKGCTLVPGVRLTPGKITRVIDANQVRIQQEVKMNGAFRLHLFLGDLWRTDRKKVEEICDFLSGVNGPWQKYKPPREGIRASIVDGLKDARSLTLSSSSSSEIFSSNPFFTLLTILTTPRTSFELSDLPLPIRYFVDQIYNDDLPDRRVISSITDPSIGAVHTKYGLDKSRGSLVVVRPDGYVGAVLDLGSNGWKEAIDEYFGGFLISGGQGVESGKEEVVEKSWARL